MAYLNTVVLVFLLCVVFIDALPDENENYNAEYDENDELDELDEPSCSKQCQNNGHCIHPDICDCPKNTLGEYCELIYSTKCTDFNLSESLGAAEKHFNVSCNKEHDGSITCIINCDFNYRIPGTHDISEAFLSCVNDNWHLKSDDEKLVQPYCEALPKELEELVENKEPEEEIESSDEVPDDSDVLHTDAESDIENSTTTTTKTKTTTTTTTTTPTPSAAPALTIFKSYLFIFLFFFVELHCTII